MQLGARRLEMIGVEMRVAEEWTKSPGLEVSDLGATIMVRRA